MPAENVWNKSENEFMRLELEREDSIGTNHNCKAFASEKGLSHNKFPETIIQKPFKDGC